MSKGLKIFGAVVGVIVLIIGLLYVNAYIYPFQSKDPNFADVEREFAKLQFPSDWQEISSTENRGIAGRQCDMFDSSGCFSKNKTFKTTNIPTKEIAEKLLVDVGCGATAFEDISSSSDTKPYLKISCALASGVSYGVDLNQTKGEVYVVAKTY